MISLGKAIKRVERYRDDIVTHSGTREALSVVLENARKWEAREERSRGCQCGVQCAVHADPGYV